MILWRIATDTRKFGADDLSGRGGAASPGRWNDDGQVALYTAPTIAIAVFETAAHIDDAGLPLNKYLVKLHVPDDTWTAREVLDVAALPLTWSAIPAGRASVKIGADWLRSGAKPILVVPSVIVPEESATLINPQHALSSGITAQIVRLFEYNRLFPQGLISITAGTPGISVADRFEAPRRDLQSPDAADNPHLTFYD